MSCYKAAIRFDDGLRHYGVIGMKWGIRRNKDTIFSRTSSRMTRGLEHRIRKDEERVANGKQAKYDTQAMKRDLEWSKRQDEKTKNYVSKLSTGKTIAQSFLMGSGGALAYNKMRMEGNGRLVSAGAAMLRNFMTAYPISKGLAVSSGYKKNGLLRKESEALTRNFNKKQKEEYANTMRRTHHALA